jgi:hypothetical protein
MLRHSRLFIGGCAVAFVVASFAIGLEVSATTAAPGAGRAGQTVDRTLKSDRLPQVRKDRRNAVNAPFDLQVPPAPASKPELPDGCEPLVSPIMDSPLSHIPGRCVS